MENNENKAKKQRIIIAALILGMMFCIGITIWAVFFRKSETKSLVPDYAPQQTEQNAEPLDDNSRSLEIRTTRLILIQNMHTTKKYLI